MNEGAIRDSGARVVGAVCGMSERAGREPSALPGWSRAHVVGHLIQSADAYLWLLAVARDGAEPGPRADRARMARELEDLAGRPIGELAVDLDDRLDRLGHDARAMPVHRWGKLVQSLAGWRHPAWYVLYRCLRELETHHLDLDVGYRTEDWPADYVAWTLEDTLSTLAAREFPIARVEAVDLGRSWVVSGAQAAPVVSGAGHEVLGWLSGRRSGGGLSRQALPSPPAWPMPPAPGWE